MALVPLSIDIQPRGLQRATSRVLDRRRTRSPSAGGVVLYRDAAGNYNHAEILDQQSWSDGGADEFLAADAFALYAAVTQLRAGGERSRLNTWI